MHFTLLFYESPEDFIAPTRSGSRSTWQAGLTMYTLCVNPALL